MKSFFKKGLVLLLTAVLITNPITAKAATLAYVYEVDNYKLFAYADNDPLIIIGGTSSQIKNNENNGTWDLLEGDVLNCYVNFTQSCSARMLLVDNTGRVIQDTEGYNIGGMGCGFLMPEDGNYRIILKVFDGPKAIIDFYTITIE